MKKFSTLLILLGFMVSLNAQVLPNADFENWQEVTVATTTFWEPDIWDTPNNFTGQVGTIVVTRSTDAFTGSYAARLETKDVLGGMFKAPGLLTFADFNVNILTFEYTFNGGLPLHAKVFSLSGKYKYAGVSNDSASVLIYCYKKNGELFDTIGMGYAYLHDAADWSDFTVDMNYFSDLQPDTFNVIIMSSGIESLTPGSVMFVDDLSVESNVGVIDLEASRMEVVTYPNPVSEEVTFSTILPSSGRMLYVYNLQGKLLTELPFTGTQLTINIAHYSSGTLLYRVEDPRNGWSTGTIVKN